MITWKDATGYSKGDKERVPSIWEADLDGIKVKVHKYIGCGDTWHLTCRDLDFAQFELSSTEPTAAQREAIGYIRAMLRRRIDDYSELLGKL